MIKQAGSSITQANRVQASERLIVALDVDTPGEAFTIIEDLRGIVSFFKVGLTLQLAAGEQGLVPRLIADNCRVFLDYKYFDVPETIRTAVKRAADLGVTFLTVHGSSGILHAAVEGRGNTALKILAVTVLTSLDAEDIRELGFDCPVKTLVLMRAKKAIDEGCDGVIASGLEVEAIRELAPSGLLIVTPGIRPYGASKDDQKRIVTPTQAITSGADYLVVGRPIVYPAGGKDHRTAAREIVEEMQAAFDARGVSSSG